MNTVFLMNVLLKIRLKSISLITNNHTLLFVSGNQLRTDEIDSSVEPGRWQSFVDSRTYLHLRAQDGIPSAESPDGARELPGICVGSASSPPSKFFFQYPEHQFIIPAVVAESLAAKESFLLEAAFF